jgi:predicted CopG family antitoxin
MQGIRATITMDEEFYKEITDLSKKEERSFSNQIIYLAKKGKELTKVKGTKDE